MAYQSVVRLEELLEFLNVDMTEVGCPAERWAIKAYQVFKELKEGKEMEEEVLSLWLI